MILSGEMTAEKLAAQEKQTEQMLQQMLKVSLKDLLSSLGTEFALGGSYKTIIPDGILSIQVKNKKIVTALLDMLSGQLKGMMGLEAKKEEGEGMTLYTFPVVNPISVTALLTDKALVISNNSSDAKKALKNAANEKGLGSQEKFKTVLKRIKGSPIFLGYTDSQAALQALLNAGNTMGMTAKLVDMLNKQLGAGLKQSDFPDAEVMAEYMRPTLHALSAEKDALVFESHSGGLDLNSVLSLVMVGFGLTQNSRRIARKVAPRPAPQNPQPLPPDF